ncbi:DUF808 domain-containing protein [Pseudohalioglobus sediminis]|uniref:DUF808 domain-containing protein n=1 Tax=Pseudohalioglobus sediminis TaxID=2606449 RepID=A0A5B0WQB1_9GAMM|nr:DUF808 domain-containing protein [Pseudohalioglobus sediminis]KAA1188189.1 DUF808 domain-containing protein [Pseudohalioglobus sediminis]
MAGSSLLLLLDDIAAVLDDVSVMTKVAAKKTAGVLGDDLAVNAEKVTGVRAERELPVVWAVAKGSFLNKLILVPLALLASAFAPWLITPALLAGGLYLCFEGSEKLLHKFLHGREEDTERARRIEALSHEEVDLVEYERGKIKGAIRTDFILSAEIIVLTLGVVAGADFITQVGVLSGIAIVMTVGVYGLVAGIVKLDDAGMHLYAREGEGAWPRFLRWLGQGLISFAPWLMKALGVIGTIAMFMVGGGILLHNVHVLGDAVESLAHMLPPWLALITPTFAGMLLGLVAGAAVVAVVEAVRKLRA